MQYFLKNLGIKADRVHLILGSGVDTKLFSFSEELPGTPRVTMVSRLLWDKGVEVLVESSKLLKAREIECLVTGVGWSDLGNKFSAIPEEKIREWANQGWIEFWGELNNISQVWKESHICVFPTYYSEGLPKTLLEAAAAGRPIITTDMPGCLEIVQDKVNGIIIPIKNPLALSNAIECLVKDSDLRKKMGMKGRKKVIANFSDVVIIQQTLNLYEELLENTKVITN